MKTWKWIKSLFSKVPHQGTVESFVASKYPKSAGDVEHWVRAYYQESRKGWAL